MKAKKIQAVPYEDAGVVKVASFPGNENVRSHRYA